MFPPVEQGQHEYNSDDWPDQLPEPISEKLVQQYRHDHPDVFTPKPHWPDDGRIDSHIDFQIVRKANQLGWTKEEAARGFGVTVCSVGSAAATCGARLPRFMVLLASSCWTRRIHCSAAGHSCAGGTIPLACG